VLAERPADAASSVVGTMKPALATMRCRNGQIAGQSWGVASLIGMARSIRPWEGGLSGPRRRLVRARDEETRTKVEARDGG
jgi:hypothetical protein